MWGELPLPELDPPAVGILGQKALNIEENTSEYISKEKPENYLENKPENKPEDKTIVAAQESSSQEIYTHFYFQYHGQGIRSMAITAIDLESGQGDVTMQFARAAVDAGQTVLVIDTHLEHPQIYPQNPQNSPVSPILKFRTDLQKTIEI